MKDLSICHKAAVKEIISAINLLKNQKGSTANDIYFVLDNFYGRVQRHVIQHALSSAVNKGVLICKNNRYKVRRLRKLPCDIPCQLKLRRKKPIPNYGFLSDSGVHVRNFECRMKRRTKLGSTYDRSKSRRSYGTRSYRFREVRCPLTCDCMTSTSEETCDTYVSTIMSSGSSRTEPRRPARRRPKRRYPAPKKVKIEKSSYKLNTHEELKTSSGCEHYKDKVSCSGETGEQTRDNRETSTKETVANEKFEKCDETQTTTGRDDVKSVDSNRSKSTTAKKPVAQKSLENSTADKKSRSCSTETPNTSQQSKAVNKTKNSKAQHKYQTRSKSKVVKRKRLSSTSSVDTKNSRSKLKENLSKSVKEEVSSKPHGISYEHMYS